MSNQIVPASVSFHGTEIITVQKDGVDYVALKPVVEALGLAWQSQHAKVSSSDRRYNDIVIPLETNGGMQDFLCIPLSKLNGFLFSINPAKIPNEDTRNKVVLYQEECFIALYKYWHEGQATRTAEIAEPTEDERKVLLNDMYSHIERVRDMADNLTVIYRDINQSLNKIGNVAAILNSSEYKDRRLAVHKR